MRILAEDSSSYAAVKTCAAKFKLDNDSTEYGHRSGRPKTSTTDEQVYKFHRMIWDDKRLTLYLIAKSIGISSASIYTVFTEILGISKVSAKCVLRILTSEHKSKTVDILWELLTCFQSNPKNFYRRWSSNWQCLFAKWCVDFFERLPV